MGRLGGMKGGLVPLSVFEKMLTAADDEYAREELSSTVYAPALERARDRSDAELERELWQEVFGAWVKLVRFLEGRPAELTISYAGRFEIENIKRTVRRVLSGTSAKVVLWDLGEIRRIDPTVLNKARSMLEIREVVSRGPYAKMFELAEHRIAEGASMFAFEQVLEAAHLDGLLETAGKVRGGFGRNARSYINHVVHLLNLRWALRLKFVRGMERDEAEQFLVRGGGRKQRALVTAVLESEKLDGAVGHIRRAVDLGSTPATSLRALDRALRRAGSLWARDGLKKNFFQFASVFAYRDVRVQEVRDVMAILIGKRQGRDIEAIRNHLGLVA